MALTFFFAGNARVFLGAGQENSRGLEENDGQQKGTNGICFYSNYYPACRKLHDDDDDNDNIWVPTLKTNLKQV